MFEQEQQQLEENIRAYCAGHGLPIPESLTWTPVPFTGECGISTSFFHLAAQENRLLKESGGK